MCHRHALDTPLLLLAKRTTCLEDWKNLKSFQNLKIFYRRTISMRCALSTTKPLNGLLSSVQETCLSDVLSTPHARFKKIKCSSSEGATHPTNAITTPTISSYVNKFLFSCFSMVPTTQSKISGTSQECYV